MQMYYASYISRIFAGLALAAMGIAMWFSIVLARADAYFRKGTPESVARALEITPRNTEYLTLRALQLDYDGADSSVVTKRIAELSPFASAPRIKLGLAAEIAGDSAGAEKWLLEAAAVDHQFEPRWTLANFYFRQEKPNEFWRWMHAALEVSYADRTPAFDLCWRVSQDAGEILRRAIPDQHDTVATYLIYLAQTKRLSAITPVARRLAAFRDKADEMLLYGVCDQLLAARDAAARDIWLLAQQAAPNGIFNGDFATAPLNHGFDWRTVDSSGVTHINLSAPAGHRIALNGQQAEFSELLAQTLALATGKRYTLRWESRTSSLKKPTGIEWRVSGQRGPLAPSPDWARGELTFTASDSFPSLELIYQRPVGEPRAEGSIELRQVRLTEIHP
jgi:hypothetical protein